MLLESGSLKMSADARVRLAVQYPMVKAGVIATEIGSTPHIAHVHGRAESEFSSGSVRRDRARYMSPPHSAHTKLPCFAKSRTAVRIAVFSDNA